MTTTPATTRPPVPELEAAKLYKRVITARIAAERATSDAAQAYADAETAREHLKTIEAQYRAVRAECVS